MWPTSWGRPRNEMQTPRCRRFTWVAWLVGGGLAMMALWSLNHSQDEPAQAYVARGDQDIQAQHFREAVIEYRSAARQAPNDVAILWKLVQAGRQAGEFEVALTSLDKVLRLDPQHLQARLMLGQLYLAQGKHEAADKVAGELTLAQPNDPGGYLLRGELASRAGKFQEAVVQFQRGHECDHTLLQPMLALANIFLLQQDAIQAASWYRKAVEQHPDSVDAHVARGNYFFSVGDDQQGEQEFQHAMSLGKLSEPTRLGILVQHIVRGRSEQAIRELESLNRELKSKKGRALLTELLLELGRVPAAAAVVEELATGHSADATTLYLQGRLALLAHRREEARVLLSKAIALQSGKAAAHLYLGQLELVEGKPEKGEPLLQKAIQLDPDNPRAHLLLANLYTTQGRLDLAEREALEVLRRNPADVEAAVLYGDSHLLRDNWAQAETIYSSIRDQIRDSPLGYRKLGELARRQGLSEKAVRLFAAAVARGPQDADVMLDYMQALVAIEDRKQAGQVLRKFLLDAPLDPRCYEVAAKFHAMQGQMNDAEVAWRKMSALAPADATPDHELGQLYLTQRKLREAEAALRQAILKNGRFAPAYTSLGILLTSQGKIEEANAEYRKALALAAHNPAAANNLATNLAEHGGDLDEAVRYGSLALEHAPQVPSIMDTLGWIHYKKGSLEDADRLLARAADKLADNPTARYHYGMLLAKQGRRIEAARELESALSLGKDFPGSEEAKITLASMR